MERLRRGAEAVRLVTGTTYATVVASGSPCTTSSRVRLSGADRGLFKPLSNPCSGGSPAGGEGSVRPFVQVPQPPLCAFSWGFVKAAGLDEVML